MAKVVRGPEAFDPMGGLFDSILRQQLSESSQMRMMRKQAGLREKLAIKEEQRVGAQKWEEADAMAAVGSGRQQYHTTNIDNRSAVLPQIVSKIWDGLSPALQERRFGNDPERLKAVILRTPGTNKFQQWIAGDVQLSPKEAKAQARKQRDRKMTESDRLARKSDNLEQYLIALQKIAVWVQEGRPTAEITKERVRIAAKYKQSTEVQRALTLETQLMAAKNDQIKNANARIDRLDNSNMSISGKIANRVDKLRSLAAGSRAQTTSLAAVGQLARRFVSNQLAVNDLRLKMGTDPKNLTLNIPAVTKDMMITRGPNGEWNINDITWTGARMTLAEKENQKKVLAKKLPPGTDRTSLYDYYLAQGTKFGGRETPRTPTGTVPNPAQRGQVESAQGGASMAAQPKLQEAAQNRPPVPDEARFEAPAPAPAPPPTSGNAAVPDLSGFDATALGAGLQTSTWANSPGGEFYTNLKKVVPDVDSWTTFGKLASDDAHKAEADQLISAIQQLFPKRSRNSQGMIAHLKQMAKGAPSTETPFTARVLTFIQKHADKFDFQAVGLAPVVRQGI